MDVLWSVLQGTALFVTTWFVIVVTAGKTADKHAFPNKSKDFVGRLPNAVILAFSAFAVISWLEWIKNGWLAFGLSIVGGVFIGYVGENICWIPLRIPMPDTMASWRLVAIYHKHPEGFVRSTGGTEVQEIRQIGVMLNERGGMAKMLKVHESFTNSCGVPGAPRNLEHMWDGIGEWLG